MGRRVLLAAMAAAVLSMATPGSSLAATTRVVDAQAGPYTTITDALLAASPGDTIDIHQGHYAEDLWVDEDDITLRGAPGTIVSETGPFVVSLMGARARVQGLTIAGGPGGVRVAGTGAELTDVTVLADATALSAEGGVATTLTRTVLRATGLSGTALLGRNATTTAQTTSLSSSVLAGGRLGVGADLASGATGDTQPTGETRLSLAFSTIGGAPTAILATRRGQGAGVRTTRIGSVVRGAVSGLADGSLTDDALANPFADPVAPDLHLRADTAFTQRAQGVTPGSERDVEGRDRLADDGYADYGAYEFANRAPVARLGASAAKVAQGVPVAFDASASSDPDASLGGAITRYDWTVDGSPAEITSAPALTRAFPAVGRHVVTVRVHDQQDATAVSAPVTVEVVDRTPPILTVTAPRDGAKHRQLRRSGKRRVVHVVKLAGRASDASGLRDVDVLLQRGKVKHAGFARIGRDGTLSWHSPAKAKLARGRWTLTVWATDRAINTTRSVIHFTVT